MKIKNNYPEIVDKDLGNKIDQLNKKNIEMSLNEIHDKLKNNAFAYTDYKKLRGMLTDKTSRGLIFGGKNKRGNKKLAKSYAKAYSQSIDSIANSLTAEALDLYKKLDTRDFLEKGFENKQETSYYKLAAYKNDLNNIVVNSLLGTPNIKDRTLALEHWIRVAHKCWTSQPPNFFSAMTIIYGVDDSSVSRLKYTVAGLPEETRSMLDEMKEFFSPLSNFGNYRKYIENNSNVIPSVEVPSKDFFMLHETKLAGLSSENIAKSYQILKGLRNQIDNNKAILLRQERSNAILFDPGLLLSIEDNTDAARSIRSKQLENKEMESTLKPTNILENYVERIYKYTTTGPSFLIQPKKIEQAIDLASPQNAYEAWQLIKNPSFEISKDRIVNLVNYAKWICENKKPGAKEKDPMDEPSMMKVIAMTYLMLHEPTFFNPALVGQLDDNEKAINRAANNVGLTEVFFQELNGTEKSKYLQLLALPDPNDNNQTILDTMITSSHLPSELKVVLLQAVNPEPMEAADPKNILITILKDEKTLGKKMVTIAVEKAKLQADDKKFSEDMAGLEKSSLEFDKVVKELRKEDDENDVNILIKPIMIDSRSLREDAKLTSLNLCKKTLFEIVLTEYQFACDMRDYVKEMETWLTTKNSNGEKNADKMEKGELKVLHYALEKMKGLYKIDPGSEVPYTLLLGNLQTRDLAVQLEKLRIERNLTRDFNHSVYNEAININMMNDSLANDIYNQVTRKDIVYNGVNRLGEILQIYPAVNDLMANIMNKHPGVAALEQNYAIKPVQRLSKIPQLYQDLKDKIEKIPTMDKFDKNKINDIAEILPNKDKANKVKIIQDKKMYSLQDFKDDHRLFLRSPSDIRITVDMFIKQLEEYRDQYEGSDNPIKKAKFKQAKIVISIMQDINPFAKTDIDHMEYKIKNLQTYLYSNETFKLIKRKNIINELRDTDPTLVKMIKDFLPELEAIVAFQKNKTPKPLPKPPISGTTHGQHIHLFDEHKLDDPTDPIFRLTRAIQDTQDKCAGLSDILIDIDYDILKVVKDLEAELVKIKDSVRLVSFDYTGTKENHALLLTYARELQDIRGEVIVVRDKILANEKKGESESEGEKDGGHRNSPPG